MNSVHGRIDKSRRQIRLLRVKEIDHEDEDIHLELQAFDLGHNITDYHALSYTWGSSAKRHVLINDRHFSVSHNLFAFFAVHGPKSQEEDMWLWIDQICINQSDTAEKSWQIPLMAEIYTKAVRVLAWLGPASSDVTEFAAYLRDVKGVTELDTTRKDIDYSTWPKRSLTGIQELCEAPYWTRVWIVQEALLGRDLRVLCGPHEWSWDLFSAVTSLAMSNMPDAIHFLQFYRLAFKTRPATFELDLAIRNFDSNLCGNPNDHLYGLWALLPTETQKAIGVDYNRPTRETYTLALDPIWRTFRAGYKADKTFRDVMLGCLNLGRRMGVLKFVGSDTPWRNYGEVTDDGAMALCSEAAKEIKLQKRSEYIDWLRQRLQEYMTT